jgi:hypothetical protein
MVLVSRSEKRIFNWGLIRVALTFLILLGCAATKPNISIIDEKYKSPRVAEADQNFLQAKVILNQISSRNELLAIELGKLPELQDGVSNREKQALETLFDLYRIDPQTFDDTFAQMHQIGLPEVRRYCSPLQAIFWLAEEGEPNSITTIIESYSLKSLLDKAWDFHVASRVTEDKLEGILNGIKSEKMRQDYSDRRKRLSSGMFSRVIVEAYRKNRFAFTGEAREIIESIINPKWDGFDEVTARLNAPELVNYYEKRRFSYAYWWTFPTYPPSPRYVFKYNKGDCVGITRFTVLCLSRAGYKAREYRGRCPSGRFPFHSVCVFEMNGEKYVMDNGNPHPRGISLWDEYRYK